MNNMNRSFDEGLSKKGMQEVQMIVDNTKIRIEFMIEELKKDFDHKFTYMENKQEQKERASEEFREKIYKSINSMQTTITGLEFKHNWKTALWVFIGSACPTAIGMIFLSLRR